MNKPRILLLKCHNATPFSLLSPIITEPLELEYIAALLDEMHFEYRIFDSLLERNSPKKILQLYRPDILLLSGYIVAVDKILQFAKFAKQLNPNIITIVGGVHAEVNPQDFYSKSIDVIVRCNSLMAIKELLLIQCNPLQMESIPGITFKKESAWQSTAGEVTNPDMHPLPNRSYFEKFKNQTRYLNYSPVALIKTALSCPFACTFCYCKLLNLGVYAVRDINMVVAEMGTIQSDIIWIVDDTFLIDRLRIELFINLIKLKGIHKHFILYSRVDFIIHHEDLIEKLAGVGLCEVIVGMESVSDTKLDSFGKKSSARDNIAAAAILRRQHVSLTALFIADIDFTHNDFKLLRQSLKNMRPDNYTLSIATPLKGTPCYTQYQSAIIEHRFSKFDFLHLTMKPLNMSRFAFYAEVYRIYFELVIQSKSIHEFLRRMLFGLRVKDTK